MLGEILVGMLRGYTSSALESNLRESVTSLFFDIFFTERAGCRTREERERMGGEYSGNGKGVKFAFFSPIKILRLFMYDIKSKGFIEA